MATNAQYMMTRIGPFRKVVLSHSTNTGVSCWCSLRPRCHINAGWLRGFKNARGIQCILIKYVHANNLRHPLRNLKCHIFYVQQFLDAYLDLGHGGSSQKLNLWSCKCVHLHTRCHLDSSSAVLQNPSCTVLDVDDLRVGQMLIGWQVVWNKEGSNRVHQEWEKCKT